MQRNEAPNLDRLSSIHRDGSRKHIHPADVSGRFITARRVVFAVLIVIYVGLPFLKVGGNPAVMLDVAARRFYLFGAVFNAQDFWRVVLLVLLLGALLLFLTAWVGRVWCGWGCPQTVFLDGVYRPIERWIDGPREVRIRRQNGPWNASRVLRTLAKHGLYALVSLALAHVALSFFVSIPGMLEMVRRSPTENWTAFLWVTITAAVLHINFGWFREQLCIVVCPYGRLQSALLDRDSMIIGYDVARGEPRGKLTRAERAAVSLPVLSEAAAAQARTKGDCVDCFRCVNVCPTGIDIRNGIQMECIACAQCIDACDDVMTRLGREKGLIRYDSENGLSGQGRRTFRPRLLLYVVLVVLLAGLLVVTTGARATFEANLIRVRGAPYVLVEGAVRNQYELHLVNKNPKPTRLRAQITSPVPVDVALATHEIELGPLEHFRLPIFLTVRETSWTGPFELTFHVEDEASGRAKEIRARFLGPNGKSPPPSGP